MDRKIRQTQSKLETVKDRGDLRKISIRKESTETFTKESLERGDTGQKNKINTEKKTIHFINDLKNDYRSEQPIRRKVTDKTEKIGNQVRTYLDLEGRRRLRERYTLKLNNPKDLLKNDKEKSSDKDDKKSVGESVKSEKRKETPKRRPIIKTITVKNDNRVYKAVTFVDQKNHTPLQINIPPTNPKKKVSKSTETNFKYSPSTTVPSTPSITVPSRVSIKEKIPRRERRRKRILSPDTFHGNQENLSPVTEVAKWAPSSLNDHTKPYYEAWVNTTLSAMSRCSDAEREEIYHALKAQQLERSHTPELVYENFKDEKYAGRIKINAKHLTKKVK